MIVTIRHAQTINVGDFETISPSVEITFENSEITEVGPEFRAWYDECAEMVQAHFFRELQRHLDEVARRRSSSFYRTLPYRPA